MTDQTVRDGVASVIEEIAGERLRQVSVEGWTPEHDDGHPDGSLARAAAAYAWSGHSNHPMFRKRMVDGPTQFGSDDFRPIHQLWPWSWGWWKPKGRRDDLIRAAALIVAEIERLDRARTTLATMEKA